MGRCQGGVLANFRLMAIVWAYKNQPKQFPQIRKGLIIATKALMGAGDSGFRLLHPVALMVLGYAFAVNCSPSCLKFLIRPGTLSVEYAKGKRAIGR